MRSDYSGVLTGFGLALREARVGAGLSQEALAVKSGLDRTYVSGAERGVRNPTLITLARLSAALGVNPGELVRSIVGEGRR